MTPVAVASAAAAGLALHTAVNAQLLRTPTGRSTRTPVSVLLPVRDEADRVRPCIEALLAQQGADLEVVVLDDNSSDGTADIVRTLAADDPRVRVLAGGPLPQGWLGKPYACQQLADAAAPTSEVLVFLDADVVLAPHAIAATVTLLEQTGLDLLSPYPRQEAPGPTALVQPLLQWSWLTFLPLRAAERSARPSLAAANGQLLAVRRGAYDRAGGHAAVRAEVVEDVELLRAVKRIGGRGGVCDGTPLATTCMYRSWAELADGYTKSLWTLPGPAVPLLLLLYVAPPLAALRGSRAGAMGYAAGVAGRVVAARRTGSPAFPAALAHPVSVVLLAWLSARSRLAHRRGTLTWKGRGL